MANSMTARLAAYTVIVIFGYGNAILAVIGGIMGFAMSNSMASSLASIPALGSLATLFGIGSFLLFWVGVIELAIISAALILKEHSTEHS